MEKTTLAIRTPRLTHQVQARQKQWTEQEIAKRETVRYHDVKLIVDRFNTLMRKSGDAIANPQARYDEAYRCWQQDNKGDGLKGIR